MTGIVDRFIYSKHGRVHVLEAGEGPVLFLMHTLGGSAYQFIDSLPLLAKRFRVIAWDMPGHGDSDPLTRHLSVEDYSDALISMMDQIGCEKAHVFGQSVGGYIAADLAARWGERMNQVFIGEAPPRVLADYVAGWARSEQNWTTITNTLDELLPRFRNATPALLVRWNMDRSKAGAKCLMDTYWALREFDFFGALAKIKGSATLVLGENNMAKQLDKYRASGMNPFRTHVMKNCGHFLSIDDPQQLTDMICGFVDGKLQ